MAHPPASTSASPFLPQARTLFLCAVSGTQGVLVEQRGGKAAESPRRFRSPAAALAWCLAHRAGFVLFWPPSTPLN